MVDYGQKHVKVCSIGCQPPGGGWGCRGSWPCQEGEGLWLGLGAGQWSIPDFNCGVSDQRLTHGLSPTMAQRELSLGPRLRPSSGGVGVGKPPSLPDPKVMT